MGSLLEAACCAGKGRGRLGCSGRRGLQQASTFKDLPGWVAVAPPGMLVGLTERVAAVRPTRPAICWSAELSLLRTNPLRFKRVPHSCTQVCMCSLYALVLTMLTQNSIQT